MVILHFFKLISLEEILNYMTCKFQYNQINISIIKMCLKIIILSFGGEYIIERITEYNNSGTAGTNSLGS